MRDREESWEPEGSSLGETRAGVLERGPGEDGWLLVSGMLDVESQRVRAGRDGV